VVPTKLISPPIADYFAPSAHNRNSTRKACQSMFTITESVNQNACRKIRVRPAHRATPPHALITLIAAAHANTTSINSIESTKISRFLTAVFIHDPQNRSFKRNMLTKLKIDFPAVWQYSHLKPL
jgi:hypothetical protein